MPEDRVLLIRFGQGLDNLTDEELFSLICRIYNTAEFINLTNFDMFEIARRYKVARARALRGNDTDSKCKVADNRSVR